MTRVRASKGADKERQERCKRLRDIRIPHVATVNVATVRDIMDSIDIRIPYVTAM